MTTRKWGQELLVNTTTTGAQLQPTVTTLSDGGFVIAWKDTGPFDTPIRWQRFDATGAKLGTEKTISPPSTFDLSDATITTLSDGNIWIAQNLIGDVTGAVFTPDGTFVRNQNVTTNGLFGDVASMGTGSVVAFTRNSGSDNNIVIEGFNAAGGSSFAETVAHVNATPNQTDAHVHTNPSGSQFVVTWSQSNDIFGRVFTNSGVPLVTEFAINVASGGVGNSDVVWISDDRFVTVWENLDLDIADGGDGSDQSIKFIIREADGTAVGGEHLVNTETELSQTRPAVTALPNGGFVIAWEDISGTTDGITGPDDSAQGIKLQVFNALGEKVGGEILVNTTTASNQNAVQLSTLADGRVVVTWTDQSATGGDTSSNAIRSQIIDPRDGVIFGTDVPANTETLYGNDGVADEINGMRGVDTMHGLSGADTLYGGDGGDTAFGGRGDDTLFGDAGSDNLYGGLGDDELYGGIDNDLLFSSAGIDLFDAGVGFDLVLYAGETVAATVNLSDQSQNAGSALGDTLVNVERVSGTAFNDVFTGDASANTLIGQGGNDRLNGAGGADSVNGGLGSDTFVFALGQSGTTATTLDTISDYTKGAVGVGDEIDATVNLAIGGNATAATAAQASINAATGVATFAAGSGTTLADALADITARMTAATDASGEFAFFRVNATGDLHMFISDGTAGVGANDVLIKLAGQTAVGSINITAGDLTILS